MNSSSGAKEITGSFGKICPSSAEKSEVPEGKLSHGDIKTHGFHKKRLKLQNGRSEVFDKPTHPLRLGMSSKEIQKSTPENRTKLKPRTHLSLSKTKFGCNPPNSSTPPSVKRSCSSVPINNQAGTTPSTSRATGAVISKSQEKNNEDMKPNADGCKMHCQYDDLKLSVQKMIEEYGECQENYQKCTKQYEESTRRLTDVVEILRNRAPSLLNSFPPTVYPSISGSNQQAETMQPDETDRNDSPISKDVEMVSNLMILTKNFQSFILVMETGPECISTKQSVFKRLKNFEELYEAQLEEFKKKKLFFLKNEMKQLDTMTQKFWRLKYGMYFEFLEKELQGMKVKVNEIAQTLVPKEGANFSSKNLSEESFNNQSSTGIDIVGKNVNSPAKEDDNVSVTSVTSLISPLSNSTSDDDSSLEAPNKMICDANNLGGEESVTIYGNQNEDKEVIRVEIQPESVTSVIPNLISPLSNTTSDDSSLEAPNKMICDANNLGEKESVHFYGNLNEDKEVIHLKIQPEVKDIHYLVDTLDMEMESEQDTKEEKQQYYTQTVGNHFLASQTATVSSSENQNKVLFHVPLEQIIKKENRQSHFMFTPMKDPQIVEPTVSCSECGKNFESMKLLVSHKVSTHFPKICSVCAKTFKTSKKLYLHIENIHKTSKLCSVCNTVVEEINFMQHVEEHGKKSSESNKFKCRICLTGFTSPQELNCHEKTHESMFYGCGSCEELFLTRFELQKHSTQHLIGEKKICQICYLIFDDLVSLVLHIKNVHEVHENKYPERFICIICNKKLEDRGSLTRHIRVDHQNDPLMEKAVSGEEKGLLKNKCLKCNTFFRSSKIRVIHMILVHDSAPFRCHCNAGFFSKAMLDVHKLHHTKQEEKNFKKSLRLKKTLAPEPAKDQS